MHDRRHVLALLAGAVATGATAPLLRAQARREPLVGDDGLYTQPWFMQTFLDLRDDLAETAAAGKRFVVMWEQKGCPYCKETHQVNLARPEVHDFVRENFGVLQLNIWGSREVTDFDGEAMEERALARRWRVNFTPTIQFFPPSLEGATGKSGAEIEVARMPGYFKPFHFLSMFEFVKDARLRDHQLPAFPAGQVRGRSRPKALTLNGLVGAWRLRRCSSWLTGARRRHARHRALAGRPRLRRGGLELVVVRIARLPLLRAAGTGRWVWSTPAPTKGRAAPLARTAQSSRGRSRLAAGLREPVRYTPTFVLMRDGREVGRITGYPGEAHFWGLLGELVRRQTRP